MSRRIKRALEGANRLKAKQEVRKTLDEQEEESFSYKDRYTEMEMEVSYLCYQAEKMIENYECTCPIPDETDLVQKHIILLRQQINQARIEKASEARNDFYKEFGDDWEL
jgi:hypothetical protein